RYDNYSDFGSTLNPRLGLVWNTTQQVTTKLLYGRAFRAPSFAELYLANNPAGVGNKDINPETIDTLELGFNYTPSSKITSSITFYAYKINNFINKVPSSIGIEYKNTGKQKGRGIEIESSYQATDKILLSLDYAYRWTKNQITNQTVANVPKHIGHAMFDYSFTQNWYLGSEVFIVADTPREVGDSRKKINSYEVLNASLGYKLYKNIDASIAARNLFDKKYYSPSNTNPINDYPMEGLNVFAELRYRF
ncbi:TonB-dependent receptor, partial [Sulfurimonas sp. MAG313]